MKDLLLLLLALCCFSNVSAQSEPEIFPRYFIGVAYGASAALGDFGDTEVNNADAGYAQNGNRYDLFGGYLLNERVTLTGGFRYQTFATDVTDVVDFFSDLNPGTEFMGEHGDWQTYYLLVGAAYKVPIGTKQKIALYPRVGLGPLWTQSPGLDVNAANGASQNNFTRSSETGIGLGYEVGIGLRRDLGKRFALLPTFTISGGSAKIADVETRLNSVTTTRDFSANILSFNLGLSLAFRL